MSSLDVWRGEFGTEYTKRQPHLDAWDTFKELLGACEIGEVLEVGCNRGDNLASLPWKWRKVGVEPNEAARQIANGRADETWNAHAGALPFVDGTFDLVFTAGVLIHINPGHLDRALYEIHRVSRRYILSIEYEGDGPIEYRGIPDGIWKRDYGQEWLERYPLTLVEYWPESELQGTAFDGCSAWLLDKRPPVSGR